LYCFSTAYIASTGIENPRVGDSIPPLGTIHQKLRKGLFLFLGKRKRDFYPLTLALDSDPLDFWIA
jgi:hypothetical protein